MIALNHTPAQAVEQFIKITTSLSTERDLNRLLSMILSGARNLTRSEAGRIYILDDTKRHLLLEVYQNEVLGDQRPKVAPVALFDQGRPAHANVFARCAFTGDLIQVDDVYRYSGFDFADLYRQDSLLDYRTRSLVVVPLRNHEEVTIGVLQLSNMRDGETGELIGFPEALRGVVLAFASQAAVALNNVRLIEQNRQLIQVLDHSNRELEQENRQLRDKIEGQYRFASIVGAAKSMKQVFELMSKVINTDATVLLGGETGTGKELIARAIHFNSRRKSKEFVAQNCAALPESLLESELVGYKAGAFSGAKSDKKGLIELADGGTLFLDEVGDMPLELQAKLLRVLQEGDVRPLGALESRKVNLRVVAATHVDLKEEIASGAFREDLYYRLCVFPITLPPLRERSEDLPTLLHHFLAESSERYDKAIKGFAPTAMRLLLAYDYPGNVRELRNLVERAVLLAEEGGFILPDFLPDEVLSGAAQAPMPAGDSLDSLRDAVGEFEASLIERKLDQFDWNQTRTAKELDISRRTLIEKMNKYQIHRPEAGGAAEARRERPL